MSRRLSAVAGEALRDSYLLCRTIGHAWFSGSASAQPAPDKGFWWWVLACKRCDTSRVDLITEKTGEVANRKYVYPDGYEINETVVRSELRVQWQQRRALASRRDRKVKT